MNEKIIFQNKIEFLDVLYDLTIKIKESFNHYCYP